MAQVVNLRTQMGSLFPDFFPARLVELPDLPDWGICPTDLIDNRARVARLGHLPDWSDRQLCPTRPIGMFARLARSSTEPDCLIGHETVLFDSWIRDAIWFPRLLQLPDWPD